MQYILLSILFDHRKDSYHLDRWYYYGLKFETLLNNYNSFITGTNKFYSEHEDCRLSPKKDARYNITELSKSNNKISENKMKYKINILVDHIFKVMILC